MSPEPRPRASRPASTQASPISRRGSEAAIASFDEGGEDPAYLSSQLITYLGNKRALLGLIGEGLSRVSARLGGGRPLSILDAFSGSGVVSRFFKRYASELYSNDLEPYAQVAAECYLANAEAFPRRDYEEAYAEAREALRGPLLEGGIIARLYAPRRDDAIGPGDRVFYTSRNAAYLDTARVFIEGLRPGLRPFFLGPLLSEASVHANTAGVFKGFYKDAATGLGQFGGRKGDALSRILGDIELRPPVLSRYSCDWKAIQGDANLVCPSLPEVDLAYLDPPYNQHPYGSNYFMLNLLVDYREPESPSRVSGIPRDWRRSRYNKARAASGALAELVDGLKAKFVLISFNSEGFLSSQEMRRVLEARGRLEILEKSYNAFRGSRNLKARSLHVKEYLYILEKD